MNLIVIFSIGIRQSQLNFPCLRYGLQIGFITDSRFTLSLSLQGVHIDKKNFKSWTWNRIFIGQRRTHFLYSAVNCSVRSDYTDYHKRYGNRLVSGASFRNKIYSKD